MLAGHAVGIWDINKSSGVEHVVYTHKITDEERQQRYRRWKMAVDRSFGWASLDVA